MRAIASLFSFFRFCAICSISSTAERHAMIEMHVESWQHVTAMQNCFVVNHRTMKKRDRDLAMPVFELSLNGAFSIHLFVEEDSAFSNHA
jgi:hypothetical protein